MNLLTRRAVSAYLRTDVSGLPDERLSGVQKIEDRDYVVLANERRTLAIYRVRNNGVLKRMRRWPLTLNNMGRENACECIGAAQSEAVPT